MLISELEVQLKAFREQFGDVPVLCESSLTYEDVGSVDWGDVFTGEYADNDTSLPIYQVSALIKAKHEVFK